MQMRPVEIQSPSQHVLFVDDESNILSALNRLFRQAGYVIHTANSGREALALIQQHPIDLVVSDMRMPEMNGAELLTEVYAQDPNIIRILLTGYADIASTIDAINNGKIYRYIAKPWDENDLLMTVRNALTQKTLQQEKAQLEALTQAQNASLKSLNEQLEAKVEARVAELQQTMTFLELANDKLKKNLINTVQAFSHLMELRADGTGGQAKKLAQMCRKLARQLGLAEAESQDAMIAGLLHEIGKIGLNDELIRKPLTLLGQTERNEFIKYPVYATQALGGIDALKGVAAALKSQHERFDGKGFPHGISGLEIPLLSRVLAVVIDFFWVQDGKLFSKKYNMKEAQQYIEEGRGSRYDPVVVDAFQQVLSHEDVPREVEKPFRPNDLQPGMVICRDLLDAEGNMLLKKGHIISQSVIEQLAKYEHAEKLHLQLFVKVKI